VSGAKAARHEARSPTMNQNKRTRGGKQIDNSKTGGRSEIKVLPPTKLGNFRALHERADGLIVEIVVPGRYEDEIE
jgi:hypothetical protein